MRKDYETRLAPDESHVYVRVKRPKITLKLAEAITRDVTQLGENIGLTRCLLDVRGSRSVTGVQGDYKYAYERAEVAGLTRRWKMAVLKDVNDQTLDFLQTVMGNSGRSFKLFVEEAQAKEWLKGA